MNTERQRVLLVARSLQMGGVERNTVNLADAMAALGHEVHVVLFKRRITIRPSEAVHLHVFDIDKVNRLTGVGLVYDFLTRGILGSLIPRSGFVWRGIYTAFYFRLWLRRIEGKQGRFDKIIVRGQGAFEMLWALRDPRLYQVIVSPSAMRNSWLQRLYTKLLYAGKNVVVNSSGTLASLNERLTAYHVSPARVELIHNPIPVGLIKELAAEPAPLPAGPYIVHVARLTSQKNQQLLLRAYAAADVPELLVIVGSGQEEASLKRLANELGITERVLFVGEKANPYPWMKGAKLFVLSSLFEGFGLVMAEALVCGTPVVAVDCRGGVRDVLIGEQTRLISDMSVEGLAAKIREGLQAPVVVREEWYRRFDAQRIAQEFLALP